MFKQKAPKSLIGIDISASSIKMVELSGAPRRLKLERYAIEPLERGLIAEGNIIKLEETTEAIARAYRRMGSSRVAATALPTSAVILKRIIVPDGLRDDELEYRVETEANTYIPFNIEDVYLDFQVLGKAGPEELEVLLAASKRDRVEEYVSVIESAGVQVGYVDVESMAMQAAFELFQNEVPGGKGTVALVNIGANIMDVTVTRRGEQLFNRQQPVGGAMLTADISRACGLSLEDAEQAKCRGQFPDDSLERFVIPFMESLGVEISRSLQFFFTATQHNKVDVIVLAGGCAALPDLPAVIGTRTQVQTLVANPFVNMSLAKGISESALSSVAPSLMVATGLALRKFE